MALQVQKSIEMAVGILGVLIAGSAYLPLDHAWPLERRLYMMEDAACAHLLTQGDGAAGIIQVFDGLALHLSETSVLTGGTV